MILHAAWQPSVRVFRAPSQQETTWERDRMNASSIRTPFVLWGSLDWPRRQGTMHCKMRMMMKRSANWSAQGSAMIFLPALPLPPLSRSITILISRRRARVSERMRTRKRWARERRREKREAGSRCGPFTREWGKRKIEINRLHETHTHTHVCAHASYEKLRTGLDNDPGSEEVKASRQRQQTQIPPSCGSRWQREALRRASKRVAAYLLIMQDKVPYTHTHMHPPCDRICRVHGQKYKKVPLTALINWVNMSKNELMAAKEKERRSEGEGTVHCGELQHWSRRQTAKEINFRRLGLACKNLNVMTRETHSTNNITTRIQTHILK